MNGSGFNNEVYSIVAEIPEGFVITYGQIARLLGRPRCARMVGQAMYRAPAALHLPCHRVVNGKGGLVPGWEEQKKLLEAEGVTFKKNGCVDLSCHTWPEIIFLSTD